MRVLRGLLHCLGLGVLALSSFGQGAGQSSGLYQDRVAASDHLRAEQAKELDAYILDAFTCPIHAGLFFATRLYSVHQEPA